MAIAWGALGTVEDENNTIDTTTSNIVYNNPPTWSDDDLGLFFCNVDGDAHAPSTYPSGWTERIDWEPASFGSRSCLAVATKEISSAAGEPSTYTFTYTPDADNSDGVLQMARITGVDQTTPFDVTYVEGTHANDGNDNTPTINAITTNTDGALAVAIIGYRKGDAPLTAHPSGWTLREELTSEAGDKYYAIYTQDKATAGTISSTTGTLTQGGRWSTVVFALKPASGSSQTISLPHIASTTTLYEPTVQRQELIELPHIAATTTLYEPTVQRQELIELPHIASTLVVHELTAANTPSSQEISLPHIPSELLMHEPMVTNKYKAPEPQHQVRTVSATLARYRKWRAGL